MIQQKFEKGILLKDHTTFRIGGEAKYFFTANTKKDIIEAIKWAKKQNVPFFVLGGGSNILASDNGFDGLVIKIKNEKHEMESCNKDFDVCVTAEGGVWLFDLIELKLSGLEWAVGIPGITVGGAIKGAAGGFGKSITDIVKEVEVFDATDLKTKVLSKNECEFSYKESIFKKNPNLVILSAVLVLKKKDKKEIEEEIRRILKHKVEKHPGGPSAGCIFKNPDDKTVAGLLIKDAGLAGKTIGGAQISDKHSNFIINLGTASSDDVLELIKLAKTKVKEKFNIDIQEEIQYLGF